MDTLLPASVEKLLPNIRAAMQRPRNLVIIDAAEAPPRIVRAHFRAWLDGGVRLVAATDGALDDLDRALGDDTKLVILLPLGCDLAPPIAELIGGLDPHVFRIFGVDAASREVVSLVGSLPEYVDDWPAHAARTSIELTGTETLPITPALFPIRLRVSSRNADNFSAQFAITAKGEDFPSGPPVWFRLNPGFEGTLTIDRDPGLAGDPWRLEVAGAGPDSVRTLIQTVPVSDSGSGPLDLLAVVLDRTCPDNPNWISAYNLVNGKVSGDHWRNELPPENYNLEVRNGLVEGLRMAFDAGLVERIETWWFKDVVGDEMANFVTAMRLNGPAVDQARSAHAAGDCGALFFLAGYSPGLDLWDPLDEALEQAVAYLQAHGRRGHRAILLVGNSPPTDPIQIDSPLAALRTPPWARISCTTRRQSSGWHDQLATCATLGIPVLHLFLRHTQFGDVRPNDAEIYEHSQNRVEKALARTVPLATAPAERDAVREAVAEAVRALRGRAGVASRVIFEHPPGARS